MNVTSRLVQLVALSAPLFGWAGNPIISGHGVTDPHIHIFNGRAYLYATHDRGADSKGFVMDDRGIWSSADLVDWKIESVLKPEQTHIGRPFGQCWAADARDLVLRVPAGSRDIALDSLTLPPKPTSQLSAHRLFRTP